MQNSMSNNLAQSTSPYLQQHVENPVHWHEWGPEALQLARESGKPILLSVGYSACHWCHVMAHESFEDAQVAAVMNENFVNIKVDREERPDIDQIYQSAHTLLTHRSGGWPLTMFLTPETTPFFGGTYFPKTARYGLPGFAELLVRVAQYFADHQDDIKTQNTQLIAALNRSAPQNAASGTAANTEAVVIDGFQRMKRMFDTTDGGFGSAPKFPHPEMIEFCLRQFAGTGSLNERSAGRHMACFTLEHMCNGGIFDQLGGGFARYSVDDEWGIPHFEKMLYDNGPLLRLLADAWLVSEQDSQRALFKRCAEQTAGWVVREMQAHNDLGPAGYFSSMDADSEGIEGKFHVWTREQIEALLAPDEYCVVELYHGLNLPANFESQYWNLIVARPITDVATALSLPTTSCEALLASAHTKLLTARERRISPGRDEKILVSWNALMIEGLAHAGRVFGRHDWVASARGALTFVRTAMWDAATKRLFATHRDGKTHLNAYLDDYVFLIKALIEMLQADFRSEDVDFAQQLADVLLEQFEDREKGGFFFTSHDHERLIQRPKPSMDNATPSGNGVAVFALQRLSHLTSDSRYAESAQRALAHFSGHIEEHPAGSGSFLMALEEYLHPTRLVILTGPAGSLEGFRTSLNDTYLPTSVVVAIANGTEPLAAALSRPETDDVVAYLCEGVTCLAPIEDPAKLQDALKLPIFRN